MTTPGKSAQRDYKIRPATSADRGEIYKLFKLSLASGRDAKFWAWKHLENAAGPTYWLVAKAQDQIVGARAFMKWRWRRGNRLLRAVRAVDTATHPEWRRRGIFTALTTELVEQVRREGVDFIFNTPNQHSRPGYLKMGWQDVAKVPIWVKPLRPFHLAKKVAAQTLLDRDISSDEAGLSDSNIDRFLAEFPAAQIAGAALAQEARVYTDRRRDYLRWRYQDIPNLNYRALWEGDKNGGAFLIYRCRNRRGFRELMITELMASPGLSSLRLLRGLLKTLMSTVKADYLIACAARQSPEMWALASTGFIYFPALGPRLVWRPLSAKANDMPLGRWSSWRCGIGDLELF